MSGKYTCVVVCDLSWDEAMNWFEKELGKTAQKFVSGGGLMIFPTSEGLNLAPLLRRLFQTPWTGSAYYRTTWGAKAGSAPLLALCFPGFAASRQYSAKACSLRNVPFEDRVLGVTASSQHESLSMMLSGAASAAPGEATSVAEVDEGATDDYDVAVATRAVGKGRADSEGCDVLNSV